MFIVHNISDGNYKKKNLNSVAHKIVHEPTLAYKKNSTKFR